MTLSDEHRAQLDRWWQRRSPEERAALIEHRHGELSADYWQMVMDAEPLERDQPPIVAVVSDTRTGRFRLPPIVAKYVGSLADVTDTNTPGSDEPTLIEIATPGVEVRNKAQLIALSELQADLRDSGFDVLLPPENRAWTPSPHDVLTIVELYLVQRAGRRLIGKALDDATDAVYDKAKSWARLQVAKFRHIKPDDEQPPTFTVTIFGPDGKPLKTIEVTEDPDGD